MTGGNPTRVTEAGFARACSAYQLAADEGEQKGRPEWLYRRCLVCRGESRPEELSIIELPVMGGEVAMGNQYQMCSICGKEKKSVFTHYGEMACPTCTSVRSWIKNNPELAIEQVRKMAPAVLEVPVAGEGDIVRAAELAMDRQVSAARALADMVDVRKALKAGDDEELLVVAKRRMELLAKLDRLLAESTANADRLADLNESLERRLALHGGETALPAVLDCKVVDVRDTVLLDLLIDALGDTVINLDAGTIRALREVRHG
ncbi:hypothetical protein [Desulfofustis limnaeus]|uniref:Uncharacterized protein n=1 Tax=Desulfofustis limnaeus TaxID=2740163 RepID=A0ABM7WCS7_9BACT|nr:hypothetical protein [Desulfofustis limnaeus]BDD88715.1 hypothetical protein DPPLL_30800 [Desulfofustis limnaeus]